jgi:hypothetical protein
MKPTHPAPVADDPVGQTRIAAFLQGLQQLGSAAVGPLLQATSTIPIVFVHVFDPVGAGTVNSGAAGRQCHWFYLGDQSLAPASAPKDNRFAA